jgi:hypothetical protein
MSRTPTETPSAEGSPILYRMSRGTRLWLWFPRILSVVLAVSGIFTIILFHRYPWLVALGVVSMAVGGLSLVLGRSQMGAIVVRVEQDGNDIRFHRWDGRAVVASRRGRSLRKLPNRSSGAFLTIEPASAKEGASLAPSPSPDLLTFMKQDKPAVEMLNDLERRGILRGPGSSKDRIPNPLINR